MVFNTYLLISIANISSQRWQQLAQIRQRVSSQEVVEVLCCLPLQQLGRFALCLWTCLCLPSSPPHNSFYPSSDSSSSDDDDDYEEFDVGGDGEEDNSGGSHSRFSSSADFDDCYYHSHFD